MGPSSPLSGELVGVPFTTLLAVLVGVLVLAARVARVGIFSTAPAARMNRALAVRQPGWLTRRRAAGGIQHRPDRVGVGYERAIFGAVHIGVDELNHHGYVGGATGSGKTTFLRALIQGFPGPVIALDCKGDQDLAETVWSLPGLVTSSRMRGSSRGSARQRSTWPARMTACSAMAR